MTIDLKPHGWPGELLAICGFDGSGKSTLEEALVGAIAPTRPCVAVGAATEWWRNDAHVRRALFRVGDGLLLPEEALLHFNLADCAAALQPRRLPRPPGNGRCCPPGAR